MLEIGLGLSPRLMLRTFGASFTIAVSLLAAMGADKKRKEDRKRKFGGGQKLEPSTGSGSQLDIGGTSNDDLLSRKLKRACLQRSSRSPLAAGGNAVGKPAALNESTYREKESTSQKSQKFIVFVGSSTLIKLVSLDFLIARFLCRQSPIYCNR